MLNESRKSASCVERSGNIRVRPKIYVKQKLAEYLGVSSSEIISTDELTNVQARSLMADAEIYFDFCGFLHKSTFLEDDSNFTVSQCIKLIRLQLGEYNYLLGR